MKEARNPDPAPDLADRIDALEQEDTPLNPEQIARVLEAQLERYPLPDFDTLVRIASEPAALAAQLVEASATLALLEDHVASLEALVALEEARLDQLAAELRPRAEGAREKDKEAWIRSHPQYRELERIHLNHAYLLRRLKGRRAAYLRLVQAATEALQTSRALTRLGG